MTEDIRFDAPRALDSTIDLPLDRRLTDLGLLIMVAEGREPQAATCSTADACRLLGWSTRTVQRCTELRPADADRGELSLTAVLRKRDEILGRLDALDRTTAELELKNAVSAQAADTERWRQAYEELRVAHIGLARSIGNISGPHTAGDVAGTGR